MKVADTVRCILRAASGSDPKILFHNTYSIGNIFFLYSTGNNISLFVGDTIELYTRFIIQIPRPNLNQDNYVIR